MKTKTKNCIWLIGSVVVGLGILAYGIHYVFPTENSIVSTFAYVFAGGSLVFITWFARNFIDRIRR